MTFRKSHVQYKTVTNSRKPQLVSGESDYTITSRIQNTVHLFISYSHLNSLFLSLQNILPYSIFNHRYDHCKNHYSYLTGLFIIISISFILFSFYLSLLFFSFSFNILFSSISISFLFFLIHFILSIPLLLLSFFYLYLSLFSSFSLFSQFSFLLSIILFLSFFLSILSELSFHFVVFTSRIFVLAPLK